MLNTPPIKVSVVWGASAGAGFIRTVPVPSQIGLQDGAASFTTGFPPDCFTPTTSGGVPPFGQDFNGAFFQITGWNQWQGAGGQVAYDAAFSTAVGGYPQGAILASTTLGDFFFNVVDNNTNNPDPSGANWARFRPVALVANDTGTTNAYAATFVPPYAARRAGTLFRIKIANANTGASTFNPGPGAAAIVRRDGSALVGGELLVGEYVELIDDGATNYQFNALVPASAAAINARTDTQSAVTPAQLGSGAQGQIVGISGVRGSAPGSSVTASWNPVEYVIAQTAAGGIDATYRGVAVGPLSFNGSTTGLNGMDTGSLTANVNIAVYAIFNPSTGVWGTLGTTLSTAAVYPGTHLPSGFTASALLYCGQTDSSGNIVAFQQVNRKVYIPKAVVLSNAAGSVAFTSVGVNVAGGAPNAAQTVSGYMFSTANTGAFAAVAINSAGVGEQAAFNGVGAQSAFAFTDIMCATFGTIYYATGNVSSLATLAVSAYTF